MKKIYLSPPHMSGKELEYVKEVFDQNWIAPIGPHLTKFENIIKDYTGAKNAIAVTTGTAGIHLALRALGIQRGDTVLCSTLTFIGTVNPVLYEGAEPVFIDSESDSWGMCPILLEKGIIDLSLKGSLPKAIILVHIFGIPANIKKIREISNKYGIPLIEDAAESLGSIHDGKHTGTFGEIGIYSFNGNKILSTSGGGIIVTDDNDYANHMRFLSTQAKDSLPYYEHSQLGYNYRMSNVLAAIGIGQMEVLEDRIKRTREIHNVYKTELSDQVSLFLTEGPDDRANMWLTCGLLKDSINPNHLIDYLDSHNIEARRIWKPMHKQPLLSSYRKYINGNADEFFSTGICLPSGSNMTEEDQFRVIGAIKKYKRQ